MKKLLLLLSACLACVYADAQTIDKALLNGKWMLYSMGSNGQNLSRDSVDRNIADLISHGTPGHPVTKITPADSLAAAARLKEKFKDLFKTYSIYDDKGNCTMFSGVNRDENGNLKERTGTYVWSGDNKIIQTLDKSNPEAYIIVSLTATKLVIRSDNNADKRNMVLELTFVK